MLSKHKFSYLLLFVIILSSSVFAQDLEVHSKLWLSQNFTGPISQKNDKIKYLIESRLRLIDDPYVFEYFRFSAGLGYEFVKSLTGFFNFGYAINKNTVGVVTYEYRISQLLKWDIKKSTFFDLTNNSQLEERKLLNIPDWAYRLREKFTAEIPIKRWKKHSFIMSNEFFFNLNHPSWVDNHFFSENRATIGIGTQLTKHSKVIVGYLNQYQRASPNNRMSNALMITFDIKS